MAIKIIVNKAGSPGINGKTAYQYAVEAGYTGTEEQFAEDQANFASNATQVREDRDTTEGYKNESLGYKNDAEDARDEAESAKIISENASNIAVSAKNDAESAKDTAVLTANTAVQAKDDALLAQSAAESARDTAVGARNEAVDARNEAVPAANAATSAKDDAEAARDIAVQAKDDTEDARDIAIQAKEAAELAASTIDKNGEVANGDVRLVSGGKVYDAIMPLFKASDGGEVAEIGYYDTSGIAKPGANWRRSPKYSVYEGQKLSYMGVTISPVPAIVGWDITNSPQVIAGTVNNSVLTEYIVPPGVVTVAASARMLPGDVFSFVIYQPVSLLNEQRLDNMGGLESYPSFTPSVTYGRVGEKICFNPKGILSKRGTDVFFTNPLGNERLLAITPTTESDISVELKYRNALGVPKSCGVSTLKVSPAVPVTPSVPQYFIALGDSTTLGISSSGINGAWPNECSRRLTGVGTELLSGAESPAPLFLSNLHFIGTIGDQPILHEGRAGWRIYDYLYYDSLGGVSNAFWNPVSERFDLNYYINQNGFTSVASDGSNLTVFVQLGWNDVYSRTPPEIEILARELIDTIHADKSAAKVVLIGLSTPPELNMKSFTGTRNVSAESILIDAVFVIANIYKKIAEDPDYSPFVNYLHIAHHFFAEKSYPETTQTLPRDATPILLHTDYVHLNARGYAQIADAVYNYILYNYCR